MIDETRDVESAGVCLPWHRIDIETIGNVWNTKTD